MTNPSAHYSSHKRTDFWYDLPEERIANRPLTQRDTSKLLHFGKGNISHHIFSELPDLLPKNSLLVFNNTRVIQARLYFRRKTGALIEVFLLHPHEPKDVQMAMQATQSCVWECMIGNKKKWKDGEILEGFLELNGVALKISASLIERKKQLVEFTWTGIECTFAALLQHIGELPLPPYLNRKATADDLVQYQTIYAEQEGAVAAPTAGLHFTDAVMERLDEQGVKRTYVTLHVSAGTFQPVKTDDISAHQMHAEQLIITQENAERFAQHTGKIVPVGTTSMRVLESMYWLGVSILKQPNDVLEKGFFHIPQDYAYRFQEEELPTKAEALTAISTFMEQKKLPQLVGETSIFIMPGYTFRMCDGIVTNFHMPESTLIMLIAAFIGADWRKVYQTALDNDYRFLSYGDSSLLWRGGYRSMLST